MPKLYGQVINNKIKIINPINFSSIGPLNFSKQQHSTSSFLPLIDFGVDSFTKEMPDFKNEDYIFARYAGFNGKELLLNSVFNLGKDFENSQKRINELSSFITEKSFVSKNFLYQNYLFNLEKKNKNTAIVLLWSENINGTIDHVDFIQSKGDYLKNYKDYIGMEWKDIGMDYFPENLKQGIYFFEMQYFDNKGGGNIEIDGNFTPIKNVNIKKFGYQKDEVVFHTSSVLKNLSEQYGYEIEEMLNDFHIEKSYYNDLEKIPVIVENGIPNQNLKERYPIPENIGMIDGYYLFEPYTQDDGHFVHINEKDITNEKIMNLFKKEEKDFFKIP